MRLIDAEQLSEAIHDNVPAPYEDASWAKENCLYEIDVAQTVDAVPVVRCNVCVNYNTYNCSSGFGWCENLGIGVHDSFFCKVGERKEGDE